MWGWVHSQYNNKFPIVIFTHSLLHVFGTGLLGYKHIYTEHLNQSKDMIKCM